ncbi:MULTISPECIES: metal ABC transporter solute-binding protein, Zn/Mn family [Thiomicrorhabdus]|uniref:Zinc ABC transporter substrate-binding protein n=1 Tax=Thiomicrorhabdus heinhorstiae TaxID=2748010 RepID=A0ABS0BZB3_9GAMM|nr:MULTISPECIES: zinc ABC transporter substrate-binding protein [Thiomicrorhabdus]MBF6057316.1 zinc ABC transporter substrate-binding protein [Thiomicrorhabdus heinhorstiae]
MKKFLQIAKRIGLLLSLSAVSFSAQAQLQVVVTTGMIADLARNIGGDNLKVTALMGSGVDPHLYKATQGDLRRLSRADLILYNGLHLEGKMQDIFEKMARKKAVFAVSDKIPEENLIQHGKVHDPHIWFNVQLWIEAGKRITEILSQQDPKHAQIYQQRSQAYLKQLQELNSWVHQQIELIPQQKRILITAHDAFNYFGHAYGIKVMGLQGISTAAEFGLQDVKYLKDVIVANKISAVFVESSVSPKFIQSLVAGVKAEGHELKIGGELFSDAMGIKGTPEGTYIGMVKHNVHTIVEALK